MKAAIRFFYLILFMLCHISNGILAQDVVVNEYFNAASQNEEWTELIVVKDNLDMTGWYLGDNNGATASWQPKIRFKNHPIWKNLRAGTYIVIDHAANAAGCDDQTDVDKSDGFIRVCCRNTTYFEGGSTTTLFVANEGDFVQVVDASGKMIHAIGHDNDPGNSVEGGTCSSTNSKWTNISGAESGTRPCGNFLFYRYQLELPTSLFVRAGALANFSAGMQTQTGNPYIDTRDVPFEGIGNAGENAAWVVEQRKPQMAAQNVCLTRSGGSNTTITFSWEKATDPFQADGTIGYMVIRNQTNDFPSPQQGVQYAIGQTVGSGMQASTVVGLINSSQTTTFQENPGEGIFYYRAFAFKYVNTVGFGGHFTRGRTYNTEQFVKVNSGGAIEVTTQNDTLCGPGIATLSAIVPAGSSVNWYTTETSQNSISTNDTLFQTISQTRSFWVEVNSSALCALQRFEVKAVIEPIDFLYAASDSICEGTSAVLSADFLPGYTYQWSLLNPPTGIVATDLDSSTVFLTIPSFPEKRWIRFNVQATNAEGCKSAVKTDSMYTVPFNPQLLANPISPNSGEEVVITISEPSALVENWTQTGGILVSSNLSKCVVSTEDTIVVSGIVHTLLPNDGLFCAVNRSIKIGSKVIQPPILPIPNLITDNGDSKNQTLNFDAREVRNLEIFDRWGKKVYNAGTYANDWNTKDLQPGTYFFTAETKLPNAAAFVQESGWVVIVK